MHLHACHIMAASLEITFSFLLSCTVTNERPRSLVKPVPLYGFICVQG